jgi:hypothetical protein
MSSIVKYFAATEADANDALETGPDASLPTLTYGNFDAEEALLYWESELTGRSFEDLVNDDLPEIVAESDDGPMVLALSDTLSTALTSADPSRLDDLARWWVDKKAEVGVEIEPAIASEIIRELTDLIRRPRKPDARVYCWIG